MTNRKELLKLFGEITDKAINVMRGKNTDYATEEDSLANFRSSSILNVDPRKALLIRMIDKIKRQVNYIERGRLSVDSAEDDIIDLINYSVLLYALNLENEQERPKDFNDVTASNIETTRLVKEYQVGDKVEVVGNGAGHGFNQGEIVTLIEYIETSEYSKDYWGAENEFEEYWEVYEEDIKPAKETKRSFGI